MTGDVRLREVTDADLPVLFENQRDPDANRVAAFPPRDAAAFAAHWAKIRADPAVVVRTVLLDGRVAGTVTTFERGGRRLVGYWLGKGFWGRGVATRAVAELLRLDPSRPLFAHVAKSNVASVRVLEKNGFAVCGEETFDLNGTPVEDWVMTLGDEPA